MDSLSSPGAVWGAPSEVELAGDGSAGCREYAACFPLARFAVPAPMPSPHPSDRPVQRAHNLLRQEVVETRQRARLGGWFYGVAAALAFGVTGFGPGDRLAAVLVIVGLLVLAVIRVLIPLPAEPDAAQARRYLHRVWAVILATTLVWGGFSAWSQAALPAPAPLITLLFSGAFGMAIAHTLCMRRLPSARPS